MKFFTQLKTFEKLKELLQLIAMIPQLTSQSKSTEHVNDSSSQIIPVNMIMIHREKIRWHESTNFQNIYGY